MINRTLIPLGVFAKLRLESSGIPPHIENKDLFCEELSKETGFKLVPEAMVKNDALRLIAKIILGQFYFKHFCYPNLIWCS